MFKEGATFADSVSYVRKRYQTGLDGIYNHQKTENPVQNWTHVVIPYCTGDIHWGSRDITYTKDNGEQFNIYHRGAINSKAVLNWVKQNIQQPEKVLMTGCSAGSYGSIYWFPHYRKLFPLSEFYQLGDSGAGVITQEFIKNSFSKWGATFNAPKWIEGLDPEQVNWYELSLADIYQNVGAFYPQTTFTQFSTAYDDVQTFFHELMGGSPEEWSQQLYNNFESITHNITNFKYYIAPGSEHCMLPYENLYTTESNGVQLKDWFYNLLHNENIENIACVNCRNDEF